MESDILTTITITNEAVSQLPQALRESFEQFEQVHSNFKRSVDETIDYALDCGHILTNAKSITPHGAWTGVFEIFKSHFELGGTRLNFFMQCYEHKDFIEEYRASGKNINRLLALAKGNEDDDDSTPDEQKALSNGFDKSYKAAIAKTAPANTPEAIAITQEKLDRFIEEDVVLNVATGELKSAEGMSQGEVRKAIMMEAAIDYAELSKSKSFGGDNPDNLPTVPLLRITNAKYEQLKNIARLPDGEEKNEMVALWNSDYPRDAIELLVPF